jgi:3-hydroxyacyl-CoA dehydrogenase
MGEPVNLALHDQIAVVRIDNPPVNALTAAVRAALAAAIAEVEHAPGVRAIVVLGAGPTFVAGADLKELERAAWDGRADLPDFHGLFGQIENCRTPIVMALHGTALGGGLELAMAGHHRLAARDARLGQPEVNLGIIPGAGGTQRLPRLVGIDKAIDMCVSGKPISAGEALNIGLIDQLLDGDVESSAVAWAREVVSRGGAHPRTRDLDAKLGDTGANAAIFSVARKAAQKSHRNLTAPLAAIDAIEAATKLSFDEGLERERELCVECLRSEQCKALIHAFFAERGVSRVADVPKNTPQVPIASVGIVGAGTMGSGIATACANAGLPVVLIDVSQDAVDRGMAAIRRNYDGSVKRGRLTPEAANQRTGRIAGQVGSGSLADRDLIIEAVFENLALKKQVFAELDAATTPGGVILATNTSTLDIDEIASVTRRPDRVIGLHFFSPANVMRLVEIVRGRATSKETIATALGLAKRLGKIGVVVGNCRGFVGNRMMFPYMYEAQFLVEDGATPEQVDRALTDWGMAMGIFAVDDMAGLDVAWRVRQELGQFSEPGLRKPLIADMLCEMGRLGQKTGKGWYRYDGGRTPIPDQEVIGLIERVAASAGIRRHEVSRDEIIERTIYALVNEGARILDEGFAERAADIDVIYMNGYGFPSYRGGPMFFADRVGLQTICQRVKTFHRELGPRWAPAPLLERLASEHSTFRQWDAARQSPASSSAV